MNVWRRAGRRWWRHHELSQRVLAARLLAVERKDGAIGTEVRRLGIACRAQDTSWCPASWRIPRRFRGYRHESPPAVPRPPKSAERVTREEGGERLGRDARVLNLHELSRLASYAARQRAGNASMGQARSGDAEREPSGGRHLRQYRAQRTRGATRVAPCVCRSGTRSCIPFFHVAQTGRAIAGRGTRGRSAQRPAVPRSSERPAARRDHWAVGRPLVRSSRFATVCGQPGGESSHGSWRPYTVRSMSAKL